MNDTSAQLASLWEQHRSQAFPINRPQSERAGVDHFHLVELDTSIAGYVSRVVGGESLQTNDLHVLETLETKLRTELSALSGQSLEYFTSLATLARAALSASHLRQ